MAQIFPSDIEAARLSGESSDELETLITGIGHVKILNLLIRRSEDRYQILERFIQPGYLKLGRLPAFELAKTTIAEQHVHSAVNGKVDSIG